MSPESVVTTGPSRSLSPLGLEEELPSDPVRQGFAAGTQAAPPEEPRTPRTAAGKIVKTYAGGKVGIVFWHGAPPRDEAHGVQWIRERFGQPNASAYVETSYGVSFPARLPASQRGPDEVFWALAELKVTAIYLPKEVVGKGGNIEKARRRLLQHEEGHVRVALHALANYYSPSLGFDWFDSRSSLTYEQFRRRVEDSVERSGAVLEKSADDWDGEDLDRMNQEIEALGVSMPIEPG